MWTQLQKRAGVQRRKRARSFGFLRVLIFALFTAAFSTGCVESNSPIKSDAPRIDTPAGMIDYLQRANLPALKSVEVWENQYAPGLKLTTAHYEIFTTLLEPLMLSQVPAFVESAYQGYNNQLPQGVETTSKFRIYLFGQRQQWEDFTKTFAGPQAQIFCKIKAGAFYLNDTCVAYNIGRVRTFAALGHEGWHQFNKRLFKFRLPSWLDEGIAMLFEVGRYEQGLFYFEPQQNGYRLGELKTILLKNKMLPLKELLAKNPGEVLTSEKEDAVTAFYGQSYALVRFLREEGYGKRLRSFHNLLLGGLQGGWPLSEANKKIAMDRNIPLTIYWNRAVGTELFKIYIGDDFDRLEKEYLAFCRKIVYHVSRGN